MKRMKYTENIGNVGGLDGKCMKMKAKAKLTMTVSCRIQTSSIELPQMVDD